MCERNSVACYQVQVHKYHAQMMWKYLMCDVCCAALVSIWFGRVVAFFQLWSVNFMYAYMISSFHVCHPRSSYSTGVLYGSSTRYTSIQESSGCPYDYAYRVRAQCRWKMNLFKNVYQSNIGICRKWTRHHTLVFRLRYADDSDCCELFLYVFAFPKIRCEVRTVLRER